MKKIFLFLILLFISINCKSQSLGKERIDKLRKSVVKVITNDGTGTAFFISDYGSLLTCWHVVSSSCIRDKNSNQIIGMNKIYIELNDGSRYEAEVYPAYLNKFYGNALVYDYCVLIAKGIPKAAYQSLKLGNFSDINEGDELYSCGYPLNMTQQFISKGILSTKYQDTVIGFNNNKDTFKIPRNVAVMDITLNHGNSGGPIIKLSDKPENDAVIGIADFIITPYGDAVENVLNNSLNSGYDMAQMVNGKKINSLMNNTVILSSAILNSSVGISACMSIDYYYLHER